MIQYLSALTPAIPFDFGEVGCAPGGIPDDTNILERSFGAALWQVDFMLYSMSVGVNRVHIQSGYGFEFSLWQPEEFDYQPAAVYANYYAHLFVADFISASGAMQALELPVTPTSDTLTAYAAYEHGSLQRLALINMDYYDGNTTSSSDRPSQTLTIAVPSSVHSVTVHALTAPSGATALDTADITWAGQTYTLDNEGMAQTVGNASTVVQVQNGYVSIPVLASEAVIVYFGAVNATANGNSTTTTSSSSTATGTPTPVPTGAVASGATTTGGTPAAATATLKGAASGLRLDGRVLGTAAVLATLVGLCSCL